MAIKPTYYEEDLFTGEMRWGLAPDDFKKVVEGYGCPKCLEDFNGVFLLTCPVCKHTRIPERDFLPLPEHWKPGKEAPAPRPEL